MGISPDVMIVTRAEFSAAEDRAFQRGVTRGRFEQNWDNSHKEPAPPAAVPDRGASRVTVERVLRDDDDHSGQTIRDWKIETERGHITIRLRHGDGFLMLRPDDIEIFIGDLHQAETLARDAA